MKHLVEAIDVLQAIQWTCSYTPWLIDRIFAVYDALIKADPTVLALAAMTCSMVAFMMAMLSLLR